MAERKFSDIVLVDEFNGVKKGDVFEEKSKLYKVFGFDLGQKFDVCVTRILKTTGKASPKQSICEFRRFADIDFTK